MSHVISLASRSSQHRILYRLRSQHIEGIALQRAVRAIQESWIPRLKLITAPPPVILLPDYSAHKFPPL